MRILFLVLMTALSCGTAFARNPLVELKTTQGNIFIELYPAKAPKTVANFLRYVKGGFYDGTIFHRVIDGFMIQGGGFERDMTRKTNTRPPIVNEAANGLKNEVGTIAMARTSDPQSATSQFFINLKDNNFLDYRNSTPRGYGYAVFGKVTRGMDAVFRIAKVPTTTIGRYQNVPRVPVVIQSATIITTK